MRQALLPTLLLAAASAAAAGPAPELLAQAERQVRRLEALAELSSSGALGPAGWAGPGEAAAYCAASPMTLAAYRPARDRELVYACRAYAGRQPELCRERPGAYDRESVSTCVTALEHMALFMDLVAPGPQSQGSCEACFGIANPRLPPEDRVKSCAALAGPGDERARCQAWMEAVPSVARSARMEDCIAYLSMLTQGRGCADFHPMSTQNVMCPAFETFKSAHAAGRAQDCGEDFLCRALMGEARACDDRLAVLVSSACAALKTEKTPPHGAAPVAAGLRREIDDTVSFAANLTVLDQPGREALLRLNDMMLGRRETAPAQAAADMAALRAGNIDELLYRAGQDKAAAPEVRKLRDRAEKARKRLAP